MTQLSVGPRQVRLLQALITASIIALSLMIAGTVLMALGLTDYRDLAAENYALRTRISSIDKDMDQVDDAILRIRLYESQIRRLYAKNPSGDGLGPMDQEEYERFKRLQDNAGATMGSEDDVDMGQEDADTLEIPLDIQMGDEEVSPGDIRPAELWAMNVEARTDRVVSLVKSFEPHVSGLVQNLEDWRSVQSAFPSIWPIQGQLSSGFGLRRSPFGHMWKFHTGLDIAADRGTPIMATAAGVVVFSGYYQGYGWMVEIDHGYGIHTRYAHNTSHFVREGNSVNRGQKIATVGATGRATGPHVHFELLIDGTPVNPIRYLP